MPQSCSFLRGGRRRSRSGPEKRAGSARRRPPDLALEADLWRVRGLVALERQREDAAREHFARALQASQGVAGAASLPAALTHFGLGNLLQREGRLAEAAGELGHAIHLLRAVGATRHEVVALVDLSDVRREQGLLEEARQHLDEALVGARHLRRRATEGFVLHNLALVEADRGALASAADYCTQAMAVHREVGNQTALGHALSLHGALLHALGDLAGARARHQHSLRVFGRGADRRAMSTNWGYLALLDWEAAHAGRARARVGKAIELGGSQRLLGPQVLFLAVQAALAAESGDIPAADRAMEEANARLAERRDGALSREPVALLGGVVELAKARCADSAKGRAKARARRAAVLELCGDRPGRPVNAIIALRLLRGTLARDADAAENRSGRAVAGPIDAGPEARWFRLPGGERIDLGRRRSTRLVLLALTRARLSSPGTGLGVHELLEAAWPGERMLPHAGLARVYTTIRVLRSLGLGERLLTRDDGYLLDPEQPVRHDPEPPPLPRAPARARRGTAPKARG